MNIQAHSDIEAHISDAVENAAVVMRANVSVDKIYQRSEKAAFVVPDGCARRKFEQRADVRIAFVAAHIVDFEVDAGRYGGADIKIAQHDRIRVTADDSEIDKIHSRKVDGVVV